MHKIAIRLRDWWRGYTNEDLASAMQKMEGPHEWGTCIVFSDAEHKAWRDIMCGRVE